jgi:hypothetical protein
MGTAGDLASLLSSTTSASAHMDESNCGRDSSGLTGLNATWQHLRPDVQEAFQ